MPPDDRWTTFPFPAYSYVSGRFPHPLRDCEGHGCQGPEAPRAVGVDDSWEDCLAYLWGIDLYHAGFYWEAHEAWEGVWHAAGRQGVLADFLKGLIRLAAAGVKAREGRADGIRRHAARAGELFARVGSDWEHPDFRGQSLSQLRRLAASMAADAESLAARAQADLRSPILGNLPLQVAQRTPRPHE